MRPWLHRLAICLVLLLSSAHEAWGWENRQTHPGITDAAQNHFERSPVFDRYLREYLGLADGKDQALALVKGFDDDIDSDIAPFLRISRLKRSLSLSELFRTAPGEVRVEVNNPACAESESCTRYPIAHLLRNGVFAEDNPNPRAQHHFHDPERDHPAGSGMRGLDNSQRFLFGLDVLLFEVVTPLFGGNLLKAFTGIVTAPFSIIDRNFGNFDLEGRSAIDRALDREAASDEDPRNLFALPNAERYLYRALTAPGELEREHYLALHFLAFAHVLHMLEDMSSVAHTRNDFLADHVLLKLQSLETAGVSEGALSFIDGLRLAASTELFRSRPVEFLELLGAGEAERYVSILPSVETSGFDVSDFWDRAGNSDPADLGSMGLAELVHDHFFSGDSFRSGYQRPLQLNCDGSGPSSMGSGLDEVFLELLPERVAFPATRNEPEEPADPNNTLLYLSSPLVPHLARCRYHDLRPKGSSIQRTAFLSVIDESVQRDYLELLLPLAIEYSRKFMEFYLAPRVRALPIGGNQFKLENLTNLPFRALTADLLVVYDDAEGTRHRIPNPDDPTITVRCTAEEFNLAAVGDEAGDSVSSTTCTLPDSLGMLPPPADPNQFLVVVRGIHGERGSLTGPDEDPKTGWKEKDFVVAFAPGGPGVIYLGVEIGSTDDTHVVDLYSSPVDLQPDLESELLPTPSHALTSLFRGSPLDDFSNPELSPDGTKLAFLSDFAVAEQVYSLPIGGESINGWLRDVFLYDPTAATEEGVLARLTPESTAQNNGFFPVWAAQSDSLFFRDSSNRIVQYDTRTGMQALFPDVHFLPVGGPIGERDSDPNSGCVTSHILSSAVQKPNGAGHLLTMRTRCLTPHPTIPDGVTSSFDHLVIVNQAGDAEEWINVQGESAEVQPCIGGACDFGPTFTFSSEGRSAWSPTGLRLVFTSSQQREDFSGPPNGFNYNLFVADFESNPPTVHRLPVEENCITDASWLPDGEHIIYHGVNAVPQCPIAGHDVFVIRADETESSGRRITRFEGGLARRAVRWLEFALPVEVPAQP